MHLNDRRFVCDLCGKSFVRAHGLQSHLLSHSTETPFPCDICGKRFKNLIMLKNHQMRHNGIKKFVSKFEDLIFFNFNCFFFKQNRFAQYVEKHLQLQLN